MYVHSHLESWQATALGVAGARLHLSVAAASWLGLPTAPPPPAAAAAAAAADLSYLQITATLLSSEQ